MMIIGYYFMNWNDFKPLNMSDMMNHRLYPLVICYMAIERDNLYWVFP